MGTAKKLAMAATGIALAGAVFATAGVTANAGRRNALDDIVGGVSVVLNSSDGSAVNLINAKAAELNIDLEALEAEKKARLEAELLDGLVMANVTSYLNVREEPTANSASIGRLYKDCGGTVLELADGWTKIQSGNVVGWCSNDYLYFGDEAQAIASEVGMTLATVNTETLRVRAEATTESETISLVPMGDVYEVVGESEDQEWVCIVYEGCDAYVYSEYVDITFRIDTGETNAEIQAREEAEREAKRHQNYGEYTTDADTTLLLAALIHCEAGGEPYEGQVAVGAVVMNRVRSGAYPDTIHGVIYASGQFTPAMNGRLNEVYESGKIYQSCIDAAEEALSGVSNVGACTHFRRNDGREGIVIGNHVFY